MPCLRATGTMSRSASREKSDHSICRQPGQTVSGELDPGTPGGERLGCDQRGQRHLQPPSVSTSRADEVCSWAGEVQNSSARQILQPDIISSGTASCCIHIQFSSPACSAWPYVHAHTLCSVT